MNRPSIEPTDAGFRVSYGDRAITAPTQDEAWTLSGRIMPETEALNISRTFRSLSPPQQEVARKRLQAYHDAASEEGRDPYANYHAARTQAAKRLETLMIDGEDAWYSMLGDAEKVKADAMRQIPQSPENKIRGQNARVMAWILGKDPREVSSLYDANRSAFAQQVFGQPAADDAEFHSLAKSYLTRQRDERALMEEMGDRAMRASLAGRSTWLQEFEGWQREAKADPRYRAEHADAYLKQWRDAARAIDEKIGPYRKDVAAVEAMLRQKAEADDLDGELGPVWDAMQQLAKNPDRETRQLLIAALGARVESGGEAGREGSRLYGALQRGAGNLRDDALSGGIRLLSRINDLIPGADPDLNQAVRDDLDLFADIKDVIAGNIDPIKPMHGGWMGKVEQGLYDAAQSVPYTVAAIGGSGAMTMAGLAFSDQNYNELRRTNPDMSRGDAELIAAAAAPFQVFVERWVTQRTLGLGKRLPGIDRLVTRLSSPVGGGILTRFAAYGSAAAAAEYAEEKIQDVAPLALQEVYSALKSDVPGVDWSQFEVFDSRTFFAVLPFALVGAGATTASDWAGATYFKENPEVLKYLGVPEASIQAIAEATTARETTAAVRAAWDQRTEKADTLAEYADLARREADRQAAEVRQAQRNPGTVRFERTEEGWAAVAPDGSRVETASFEQAQAARDEMMQAQGTGHSEAVRSMVDWFAQRAKPGESFEFDENFTTLAEQVAAGVTTEQEAFERVQIAERLSGGNFEGSQFVLGRNATEFKDGVFASASRLYRGANVLTVIEEKGEGDVKRWLASGELSRDQIAGWLREWEDQTGDSILGEEVTDQSLVEAWSGMVQSYAAGRFGENADAAPTGFSAALKAILDAYREFFSRVMLRAGELMRLRSEGRLNQDFETYLQRSIGLDESQVYAREVEAASGEIATFSVGPISSLEQQILSENPQIEQLSLSETSSAISIDKIRVAEGERGKGVGTAVIRRLQERSQLTGKPLILTAEPEAGKKTALDRFYQNLGFKRPKSKDYSLPRHTHIWEPKAPANYTPGTSFSIGPIDFNEPIESRIERYSALEKEITGDTNSAGIKLKTGHLFSFTEPHVQFLEKNRIHPEDIRSGGWIVDGDYRSTAQSDTLRWKDRKLAQMRVLKKRGTFSIGPAQDAEYMAAVERGDMDAAQRMVDEAAKAAGFSSRGLHGSTNPELEDDRFKIERIGETWNADDRGFFFIAGDFAEKHAENYTRDPIYGVEVDGGGMIIDAYLATRNPLVIDEAWSEEYLGRKTTLFRNNDVFGAWDNERELWMGQQGTPSNPLPSQFEQGEHDSVIIRDDIGNEMIVVFDPSQIKSADPVTRDAEGNVVPLSQRFNPADDRITFSLAPTEYFQKVASKIDSKLRNPKSRREFFLEMRRRVADKGTTWIDNSGEFSTIKAVDARARQIEAELYEREMERVGELAFYEDAKTLDHPLLSHIRDSIGNFMSRGEGVRRGYNEALWDDMPPMPSQLMGGTLTPDQISQALHADGLIRADDVPAMWAEIESALKSQRGLKEAIAEAKKAERAARKKAREEARDWAEKEKEKVWKSAPQRDRQDLRRALATLEAMVAALPAEIRGKIGGFTALAKLATERARMEELERRIDKIDRELDLWLRKDFTDQMEKLVEKASPKREAGKGTKGKIGVEGHRFFDAVEAAMLMDGEQTDTRIDEIEAKLSNPELSEVEQDALLEEYAILTAYGAWETRSAEEMAAGLDKAEEVYKDGRDKWNAVLAERREERKALRAAAVEEAGGTPTQAQGQRKAQKGRRSALQWAGDVAGAFLSLPQTLDRIFGKGETGRRYEYKMRLATDATTDELIAMRREFYDKMAEIFGVKAKGYLTLQSRVHRELFKLKQSSKTEIPFFGKAGTSTIKVPRAVAEEIIAGKRKLHGFSKREIYDLTRQVEAAAGNKRKRVFQIERLGYSGEPTAMEISQLQGVYLSMLWRHEPYQEAMRYHGYADETIDAIEAWLTPEAKAIRAWMAEKYETGYDAINAIHKRRFGIDLPKVRQYVPGLFRAQGTQGTMEDPFGSGLAAGGMRAGFTKRRRTHKAKPYEMDALTVFWGHQIQTSYWRYFSESTEEMRAVLSAPEVKEAIEAHAGTDANKVLQTWIDAMENDGIRQAQHRFALEEGWGTIQNRFATAILGFRALTIFKQLPAMLGSLADLSASEWLRSARRVMTGRAAASLKEMMGSKVIRRRLEAGATPEIRQVIDSFMANPSKFQEWNTRSMLPMQWKDALATTFSAAIAYDAHYTEAIKRGASEEMARSIAEFRTSITIGRTAQPSETMDRSMFELTASGISRLYFMFRSEARQKAMITYMAMRSIAKDGPSRDAATKLFATTILMPMMTTVIGDVYKDLFSDYGDEEGGDSIWEWEDYAHAVIVGQSAGVPIGGEVMEMLARMAFGKRAYGSSNPLADRVLSFIDFIAYRRKEEGVLPWQQETPERAWDATKEWVFIALAALSVFDSRKNVVGPVADFLNSLAITTNVLDAVFGAADNLIVTEDEIEERERRAKKREKESQ